MVWMEQSDSRSLVERGALVLTLCYQGPRQMMAPLVPSRIFRDSNRELPHRGKDHDVDLKGLDSTRAHLYLCR